MSNQLTRSQKTDRAYKLAVGGTISGVVAVVLLFVSGFGLFLLFAVISALCFLGFRRTVTWAAPALGFLRRAAEADLVAVAVAVDGLADAVGVGLALRRLE